MTTHMWRLSLALQRIIFTPISRKQRSDFIGKCVVFYRDILEANLKKKATKQINKQPPPPKKKKQKKRNKTKKTASQKQRARESIFPVTIPLTFIQCFLLSFNQDLWVSSKIKQRLTYISDQEGISLFCLFKVTGASEIGNR